MLCGLVPYLVRHRIGAIAQPRCRLGQRQRCALSIGEVRRVTPRRHGKHPLIRLVALPAVRVHIHAQAATVDLADA
jgi:hypothetical protein